MLYCLNPSCPNPENPVINSICHGCKEKLEDSTQKFIFRIRYSITKFLGEGTFGKTYFAIDNDLMSEPRVIKKLITKTSRSMQDKVRKLFFREAKQLHKMHHPQIPKLHAYFEQNNELYLVQEFIEGDNLFDEIKEIGIFSEEKIKSLLQDLLPVLDYIHGQKILHRDIKPHNIMRCKATGKLILIDFGGAKNIGQDLINEAGTIVYTPGYAAIEHMMGNPSPASDIYSLGATCIRLLTGCFIHYDKNGNSYDELYDRNILKWRWHEYLQKKDIKISENLKNILDRMLMSKKDDRYQSAQEIIDILNLENSIESKEIVDCIQPSIQSLEMLSSSTEVIGASPSKAEVFTPVSSLFLSYCKQKLTHYIGPITEYILEDTLAKNPKISSLELVELLSVEIPDPHNAQQFKEYLIQIIN